MPIKQTDPQNRVPKPKFAMTGLDVKGVVPGTFLDSDRRDGVFPKQHGKIYKTLSKGKGFLAKRRKIILRISGAILGLALLIWLFLYGIPVGLLLYQTDQLSKSNYNQNAEKAWADQVNNFRYFTQTPATKNSNTTDDAFGKAVLTYMNGYKEFNKQNLIQLPAMTVLDAKESQIDLEAPIIDTDNTLLVGYSFTTPPQHVSFQKFMNCKLDFTGNVSTDLYFLIAQVSYQTGDIDVKGQADINKAVGFINNNLKQLLSAVSASNLTEADKYLIGSEAKQSQGLIDNQAVSKLKSFVITGMQDDATKKDDIESSLFIGQFKIENSGINQSGTIDVYYDTNAKLYTFDRLLAFIKTIKQATVTPTKTPTQVAGSTTEVTLSCKDCSLAPVDKTHALASTYAPRVEGTGLNGGGQLSSGANSALHLLVNDALTQGINIKVVSAYRSYATQVTTFNYWVNYNMKGSSSRAEAEVKANRVSAKPGHSEHQLGTTMDLKCASCGDFDNSAGNMALYKYLEENAHKFGFAISYANNTEQYTGYKYEPWHIRFIGVSLATEFFNTGYLNQNGNYLAKFLTEKGQY